MNPTHSITVTDAISHAETDLAVTLDELRMAKELVAALELDAKKIQIEIVGLKSYAKRQGLTEQRIPSPAVVPISTDILLPAPGVDLALMSRSAAVLAVLREEKGPLDRNMIHDRLVDAGRYDSLDDVSLTLSGLKRSQQVEKVGQGLWNVADLSSAVGS